MLHDFHQLWNEINAFQRCKNYWNRSKIDVVMKMWKHENLKKIKNLRAWQSSRKLNYFANVFINQKIQFSKKKNRIELQKNFNFLHLCDFCIATCDKYRNKSNYEVHQALFNVVKMNRIENVLQKILCVEFFHTSDLTKWNVFRFRSSFSSYSNTSSYTSTHNSMRHKRFFEIIEFMWKFTIELQFAISLKHFKRWVQKLLNCKRIWTFEEICLTLTSTFASWFFAISTRKQQHFNIQILIINRLHQSFYHAINAQYKIFECSISRSNS